MKPGRVVRLRVNPRDCMSVVDVLRKIDVLPRGMSFSQGVSIALASCLEGLRQANVLPRRDGFEFTQMMEGFTEDNLTGRGRKLAITSVVQSAGGVPPIIAESPETRRKRLRYEELKFKQEHDKLNWTDELQQEFMPLVDEFFQ